MSINSSWKGKKWPRCIKLTINGNFAFNVHYHGNKAPQPISIKDSMEVTINIQLTSNLPLMVSFMQRGQGENEPFSQTLYKNNNKIQP